MKTLQLLFLSITLLTRSSLFAQQINIFGKVTDAKTLEPLAFAAIQQEFIYNDN